MGIDFIPIRCDDVDEYSDLLGSLGWAIESTQLTGGHNEIGYDHVVLGDLLVAHYTCAQAMVSRCALPEGAVVFMIARSKLPLYWDGLDVPAAVMGVCRAGPDHLVKLPAGWDCYDFVVDEALIERTELFPPDFFARTRRIERSLLPLPEPATSSFLDVMDQIFDRLRRPVPGAPDPVAGDLFDMVIEGLQQVIDQGLAQTGAPAARQTRRPELAGAAVELVRARARENPTMDDLAESLGVSYRVLHYALRDAFDVSPAAYLRAVRLHEAHRMLRDSDIPVTDAAARLGFYTPGRFAAQYRRQFGDLPSITRRSSA